MFKRCLFCLILFISTNSLHAQVTGVDYLLKYNCETNLYDVNIVVIEGSATTIPQRAQFITQVSLVIPTGQPIEIIERYMPLENNQQYNGTTAANWNLSPGLIAPEEQPESDFYGITPTLSPASFYNDLSEGDVVPLFSVSIGTDNEYNENVRFFDNDNDPDGLWQYSNGFTLGGATQLYNSNVYETCITNTSEIEKTKFTSYPNPCTDYLTIDSEEEILDVTIIGIDGKIYFQNDMIYSKNITVETDHFPNGLYYLIIESNSETTTQKIIKI